MGAISVPRQRPRNPYSDAYFSAVDEIGTLLADRSIRGFHYTRLTDLEVEGMRRVGVHPSTPQTLKRRLVRLVGSGVLAEESCDAIETRSPFNGDQLQARAGKFWMCSHPVAVSDRGVMPLLRHWGGEVAHFWLEDEGLLDVLSSIGMPRVIEVAAPIGITRHSRSASEALVATFGRAMGVAPDKSNFDFYIVESLPAEAILAVHTEGDASYSSMGVTFPDRYVDVDIGRWKELTGEDD